MRRWTLRLCPGCGGWPHDEEGEGWRCHICGAEFTEPQDVEAVRADDAEQLTQDAEHGRKFWAWKYERREAECEELADRLRAVSGALRELLTKLDGLWQTLDDESAAVLKQYMDRAAERVADHG